MKHIELPLMGKENMGIVVPHREDMLLIDGVLSMQDDGLTCHATLDAGSPFFRDGRTPTYVSFELIAQTISAYSQIMDYNHSEEPSIGFILRVSDFRCARAWFQEDEEVTIQVHSDAILPGGIFSFHGQVLSGDELVAEGDLLVLSVDDMDFIEEVIDG